MIVGGLFMSSRKGMQRHVHVILTQMVLMGLLGEMLFGLGRTILVWLVAAFMWGFLIPVQMSAAQAIWQLKVDPYVQGRVFVLRRIVAQATSLGGLICIGPLADNVFTPVAKGQLGTMLQPVLGTGPGRGYAMKVVVFGLLTATIGAVGFLLPHLRTIEMELSDIAPVDTDAP